LRFRARRWSRRDDSGLSETAGEGIRRNLPLDRPTITIIPRRIFMHRRIALALALLAGGVATFALAGGAGGAGKATPLQANATPLKVTVRMTDFKFRLSTTTVRKGRPVVFTVINRGPSPHDFDIAGTKGTPVIFAGKRTTQRVTFRKAGLFRYVCTVPRHAQFGMTGRLRVR
jgi:plastocyanin